MNAVNPIFRKALAAICEPQQFDEWDDGIMHDVCGPSLAKPVQDLLIALAQFDMTRDSFGVNAAETVKFIYPKLVALREACKKEWSDQ